MARKLKHVENLCLDKPAKKRIGVKFSQTSCLDSDGVSWKNGESWEKDTCTECSCQVFNVESKVIYVGLIIFQLGRIYSLHDIAMSHLRESTSSGGWMLSTVRCRMIISGRRYKVHFKICGMLFCLYKREERRSSDFLLKNQQWRSSESIVLWSKVFFLSATNISMPIRFIYI